MTEPKPTYTADDSVRCPGCSTGLGAYVCEGPETWLQIGPVRAKVVHGKCVNCGQDYHFVASEKRLEKLLKRCGNRV